MQNTYNIWYGTAHDRDLEDLWGLEPFAIGDTAAAGMVVICPCMVPVYSSVYQIVRFIRADVSVCRCLPILMVLWV